MSTTESVLQRALQLPPRGRARVAAVLLASLDEHEDADAEKAWAAEIERRTDRVLSGESKGAPWPEVRARLMARLQRR